MTEDDKMNIIGSRLNNDELKKVSGGVGGAADTSIKAVGSVYRAAGKQTVCPKCGANTLSDRRFTDDNGKTAYEGQECLSCGTAIVYGENIL